jgi:release factor glutamine methyltransferase
VVDGDDWIEIWKKHFRPIKYGKIVICPKWIKYDASPEEEIIFIDSNMAFGTGEHETTSMCITLLEKYVTPGTTVLDIGTGSGAIAVSLAKLVRDADVVAVDISKEALAIARRNAERLGANVEFVEADALGDLSHLGEFDIIVSNPPYIPQSDIVDMRRNVVDYEPHLALFVPDDDILRFYRATADNAQKMLRADGSLWFEIYERAGEVTCEMLQQRGFLRNEIIEDANAKPRMVWSRR